MTIKTASGFGYIENSNPMPAVAVPAVNVAPAFFFSWSDVSSANPLPIRVVSSN